MGKCNLLAPVSKTTGNFLLFSQYSEDLTRESQSEDFYRVVPSRYILLNLNPVGGWDATKYSEVFQNYFEQSCSVFRDNPGVKWTPDCAQAVLCKTLFKFGLLDQPVQNPNTTYSSSSVLYSGDINITSTRQYDGVNYSEIYISVPSDTHRQKYEFTHYSNADTKIVQYPYQYICGWPDSEYPSVTDTDWPSNHLTAEYADGTVNVGSDVQYVYELKESTDYAWDPEPVEVLDDQFMKFNAVVVLYDVIKRNMSEPEDTILYKNVPMGIYFTGAPYSDGMIQNAVTLWTSHPDIYEQGTSYGFRIGTRYLTTQNALQILDSSIEDTEDMYDQYSAAVGKLMDSQTKMDAILKEVSDYQQNITSHLANIKNYKVNVPYLREIGGRYYWFVNGQNQGVAAHQTSLVWENF